MEQRNGGGGGFGGKLVTMEVLLVLRITLVFFLYRNKNVFSIKCGKMIPKGFFMTPTLLPNFVIQ